MKIEAPIAYTTIAALNSYQHRNPQQQRSHLKMRKLTMAIAQIVETYADF